MFALAFAAVIGSRRCIGIVSQISLQTPCPEAPAAPVFVVPAVEVAVPGSINYVFECGYLLEMRPERGLGLRTQPPQILQIELGPGARGLERMFDVVGRDQPRHVDEAAGVEGEYQRN